MLLGVHCSISGGYENAFIEAERLGINTFQIFTKNQRQWREKTVTPEEAALFRENLEKYGIKKSLSHTTYLINIAAADDKIREQSIFSLVAEIKRCTELGIDYAVLHPGSYKNSTIEKGIQNIVDGLLTVLEHTPESTVKILLENTAGQGSSIGGRFEEIGEIIDAVNSDRIGMCFDTCHAFVAGYDLRTFEGFDSAMAHLDKHVGLQRLYAFHFNDSKGDLSSHLDRHENIGKGKLGLEPFRLIMERFPDIPKVLETPKEGDMDRINLEVLRALQQG
jgi:deoxyribonuclease IV